MRSAVANWQARIRGLRWDEVGLLLEAQRDLIACQVAKWRRPAGELLDWNAPADEQAPTAPVSLETIRSVGWAVTRAAGYGLFRPKCLVRSLAIQRMLRRRGITSGAIRIGVRLREGEFNAHAWVELGGVVIGDSRTHVESFTPITDHRLVEL